MKVVGPQAHFFLISVCNKAFARRDKLVIHMNKFKHVTPTNIAPLGKRKTTLLTISKSQSTHIEVLT